MKNCRKTFISIKAEKANLTLQKKKDLLAKIILNTMEKYQDNFAGSKRELSSIDVLFATPMQKYKLKCLKYKRGAATRIKSVLCNVQIRRRNKEE